MSVSSRTIIVGGIESKSGISPSKDGKPPKPWTRYSIKDQSDRFVGSTFSDTIVGVFKANIGQQVSIEVEERENPDPTKPPFRDIVSAMPGVVASAAEAREVGKAIVGTVNHSIRVAALQAAASAGGETDQILALADTFVSWITETDQVQHMRFDPDETPF